MTLRTMCGAVIAGILAGAVAHSDQTAAAVFLKGNEVYARAPGRSEPVQLTNDGRSKGLLVQSKDGTQIAFARDSVEPELADIVVMRVDGSDQREIHFRPAPNNIEGMRGVESLEWLSEGRLIAYGSLNPSTVEYAVLDVASGETVGGYLADGVTLVPSPDGSHVAYVGFVPHFTAPKDRRPRFCLDSDCPFLLPSRGYPQGDAHLEFDSKPLWSPDGSVVAILAENFDNHDKIVVIRPVAGKYSGVAAPPEANGEPTLKWEDRTLILTGGGGSWRLEPGATAFVPAR